MENQRHYTKSQYPKMDDNISQPPSSSKLMNQMKKQNDEICAKYGCDGYPCTFDHQKIEASIRNCNIMFNFTIVFIIAFTYYIFFM